MYSDVLSYQFDNHANSHGKEHLPASVSTPMQVPMTNPFLLTLSNRRNSIIYLLNMKGAVLIFVLVISTASADVLNSNADVLSIISKLANTFNGPDHIKDTVVYGRALRITDTGNNCVTVQDRATSFKSTKCADSAPAATTEATAELVSLLIRVGQMSYDDLGLAPTTPKPVEKECSDNFSVRKCKTHIDLGHCEPTNRFFSWMHDNCYKSCGGCMSKAEIKEALGQSN